MTSFKRAMLLATAAILLCECSSTSYGQLSPISASDDSSETVQSQKTPRRSIDELLLFFPSQFPEGDWNPRGLQFEDIEFEAADGVKLHGWYCPVESPRATILLLHGNGGNIALRQEWLRILQSQLHVTVFALDYRGYGKSSGKPSVAGVMLDAEAAQARLRQLSGLGENEITLMGESLGGAIAVQLAAKTKPRGLVLQSTFSSLRDVAKVHYPALAWLVPKAKLDSVTQIQKYQGKLLQSHGEADRTIPFHLAEKLFKVANEPKAFYRVEGADHNNWLNEAYLQRLSSFLEGLNSVP